MSIRSVCAVGVLAASVALSPAGLGAQLLAAYGPVGARPVVAQAPVVRAAPTVASPAPDSARALPRKPRRLWPYFGLVGAVGVGAWAGISLARTSDADPPVGAPIGPIVAIAVGGAAGLGSLLGGLVDAQRRAIWRDDVRKACNYDEACVRAAIQRAR